MSDSTNTPDPGTHPPIQPAKPAGKGIDFWFRSHQVRHHQLLTESAKFYGQHKLLPTKEALDLNKEINELRDELDRKAEELEKVSTSGKTIQAELDEFRKKNDELEQKLDLAFLFNRVTPAAHPSLRSKNGLRENFLSKHSWPTFVISVDIRRSTELMLKARTPQDFAEFMTKLCDDLEQIVKTRYGVFDKFTGDGVLAFFPEFFSGKDAGYNAISAAHEAQELFAKHYKKSRSSFKTVLKEVGLGIGIDYGDVHIIPIAGGLSGVGEPVVYACRFGSAPAGKIYLNQPAYERIVAGYSKFCLIAEQELEIKHEGAVLCYELELTSHTFTAAAPDWLSKEP